ncbi:hypothetical protein GQ53DRAFT_825995 [Thozetella sp. PMI_491]|nr:hypothetical protein GQ53DRAFT_825995 [Thozetella sp. PMI_491]
MGFVNAKNKVPEQQRIYQAAYRAHTRVFQINPRSNVYLVPFKVVMWGTFGASMYAMGRKIAGYNTWFGEN